MNQTSQRSFGRSFSLGFFGLCCTIAAGTICQQASGQESTGGLVCSMEGYLDNYPISDGYFFAFSSAGNIAYALEFNTTTNQSSMTAIDMSDPTEPVELGSVEIGDAWYAETSSDLALISIDETGVEIYDISDPSAMHQVGLIEAADRVIDMRLHGHMAYLIDETDGILAVDLSDPSLPVIVGSLNLPGQEKNLDVTDTRAYVSLDNETLIVVDISDPANLQALELVDYDLLGTARVEVDNDLLVLFGLSRMQVYKVNSGNDELTDLGRSAIYEITNDLPLDFVSDIHLHDNILTTHHRNRSAFRFSLEDPTNPVLVGQLSSIGEQTSKIAVLDSGVLITAGDGQIGINILDMPSANAINPFEEPWNLIEHVELLGEILNSKAAYEDGLLYLPTYTDDFINPPLSGVMVLDVTNPQSIQVVSDYRSREGYISDLEVHNGIAYIATDEEGLQIVDFSTPSKPRHILTYGVFPYIEDFVVDGDTLWMLVDGTDHVLLDISDPKHIEFSAFYRFDAREHSSTFSQGKIYVSHTVQIKDVDGLGDIDVLTVSSIDLSDPVRPVRTDFVVPAEFDIINIVDGVFFGINESMPRLYTSPIDDMMNFGSVSLPVNGGTHLVSDHTLYWHQWDRQIHVFDVLDPYEPRFVGPQSTAINPYTMTSIENGIVMISNYDIQVINIDTDCNLCLADLDNNGELNFLDAAAFISAFTNNDPIADFTDDGIYDFFDISAFLAAFGAGCP